MRGFIKTGRECWTEIRGSLYTARGRVGMVMVLINVMIVIWAVVKGRPEDETTMNAPSFYIMMLGISYLLNPTGEKLLYMLPISRKKYAGIQLQKLLWVILATSAMLGVRFFFQWEDRSLFLIRFFIAILPFGLELSFISIIAGLQPTAQNVKGYQFSMPVVMISMIPMFFYTFYNGGTGSGWVTFGVMNYILVGANILRMYRILIRSEVYYDEMERR